jgi:uncharacterized membrane protein
MRVREHTVDRWTSRVLRGGVWLSVSFIAIGLVAALFNPASGRAEENPSFAEIARSLVSGHLNGEMLMFAGLVTLMLTPILRVATALVAFWAERDLRFVFTSGVVLLFLVGELIYSLR